MAKTYEEILSRLDEIQVLLTAQQPAPMTLPEAAAYLHISRQSLYRLTSRSEIAHSKPSGKLIYFRKADLDAYLTRNRVASRQEIREEVRRNG